MLIKKEEIKMNKKHCNDCIFARKTIKPEAEYGDYYCMHYDEYFKGRTNCNAFYENAYKKMWEGLKRDIKGLMKSANNYGELYLKKEELE